MLLSSIYLPSKVEPKYSLSRYSPSILGVAAAGGLTIPLLAAFHITEHKFCLGLVGRSSPPRVDRQGMCQRVKIRRGVRVSG